MEYKDNDWIKRIFEGLLITIIGGVIVFVITTGNIPGILIKEDSGSYVETDDIDNNTVHNSPGLDSSDKSSFTEDTNIPNGNYQIDTGNGEQTGPSDNHNTSSVTVKNMEALGGFVINDFYYPLDGFKEAVERPDEPQNEVKIIFVGEEVTGWAVQILAPGANFAVVLSDSYTDYVKFTATNGTYELQVYSDDGQVETVYHTQIEINSSNTYEIYLMNPEQHNLA